MMRNMIFAVMMVASVLSLVVAEDDRSVVINRVKPYEPAAVSTTDTLSDQLHFFPALIASFTMILVCEFGDKTFFIAAILAMRQSRSAIFLSAMLALIFMTVLSAVAGWTLPNLLSPKLTTIMAAGLFLFFGVKLLYDAYHIDPTPQR